MTILVLIFHPNFSESRINKRLVQTLEPYEEITLHHVYEAYPDEIIDVLAEQQLLESHDRIVLQFPLYWYSSPSLLKKWFDEVLTYGWAYGRRGKKLHGKQLLLAVTAGDSKDSFTPHGTVKFSLEELLRPIQATSNIIGTNYLQPFLMYRVSHLTMEELDVHAKNYVSYILYPPLATL